MGKKWTIEELRKLHEEYIEEDYVRNEVSTVTPFLTWVSSQPTEEQCKSCAKVRAWGISKFCDDHFPQPLSEEKSEECKHEKAYWSGDECWFCPDCKKKLEWPDPSETPQIDYTDNFPRLILDTRSELGESQSKFGKRFDVSHASVSMWESGETEAPYKVLYFCLHSPRPSHSIQEKSKKIWCCKQCQIWNKSGISCSICDTPQPLSEEKSEFMDKGSDCFGVPRCAFLLDRKSPPHSIQEIAPLGGSTNEIFQPEEGKDTYLLTGRGVQRINKAFELLNSLVNERAK